MGRCGSCGGGRRPHGMQPRDTKVTPKTSKAGTGSVPSTAKIEPRPSTHTTGRTQSFALQTPDGKLQVFGSALERDAAKVRYGGRIIQ